jgi:tRNA pseudouridine55 synthase
MHRHPQNAINSAIQGVVLVDKPSGMTSQAVLQTIRRSVGAHRAGHLGTLDPLATGLLPIVLGDATRYAFAWERASKTYTATIQLGGVSTTDDRDGTITPCPLTAAIDRPRLMQALSARLGDIGQIPPMYSSVRVAGKKLYQYARSQAGANLADGNELADLPNARQTIDRPVRRVTIHAIYLRAWREDDLQLDIEVHCGSGTYIRAIARDVGRELGTGGYLIAIRRIGYGDYQVAQAISLSQWQQRIADNRWQDLLLPTETLVVHYPILEVDDWQYYRLACGQRLIVVDSDSPSTMSNDAQDDGHSIAEALIPSKMWEQFDQKSCPSPQATEYHPARLYHRKRFRGLVEVVAGESGWQLHAGRMMPQGDPPQAPRSASPS